MIPTFRYIGGKARIRDWIASFIPSEGRIYIEPFAGRGNVAFYVIATKDFGRVILNDVTTWRFFEAIREVNILDLPDETDIDAEMFETFRASPFDPVAILLEHSLTFGGMGYALSSSMPQGDWNRRYTRRTFEKKLLAAKELLSGVEIKREEWWRLDYKSLTEEDFVYFDPPYYERDELYKRSISHEALVELIESLKCKWALSGYANELYLSRLGTPTKLVRNHETGRHPVVECLWTHETFSDFRANRRRLAETRNPS